MVPLLTDESIAVCWGSARWLHSKDLLTVRPDDSSEEPKVNGVDRGPDCNTTIACINGISLLPLIGLLINLRTFLYSNM